MAKTIDQLSGSELFALLLEVSDDAEADALERMVISAGLMWRCQRCLLTAWSDDATCGGGHKNPSW